MFLTLTFFLALLLAWPTVGLSLILWLGLFIFVSITKAKARMHYADEKRALRELDKTEDLTPPSWVNNADEVDTFFQVIEKIVTHKGIPRSYVRLQIQLEGTRDILLGVAGRMEDQGSSYSSQQIACTDFVVTAWGRLAQEHKQRFLALG